MDDNLPYVPIIKTSSGKVSEGARWFCECVATRKFKGVKSPSTKSGIGSWNVTIYMDLHSSLATPKGLEIHISFLSLLSKLHNGSKRFGYIKPPHI